MNSKKQYQRMLKEKHEKADREGKTKAERDAIYFESVKSRKIYRKKGRPLVTQLHQFAVEGYGSD